MFHSESSSFGQKMISVLEIRNLRYSEQNQIIPFKL